MGYQHNEIGGRCDPNNGQAWRNYPHAPPQQEQMKDGRNQVRSNSGKCIPIRSITSRYIFETGKQRMVFGEINMELDTAIKFKYRDKSKSFGKKIFKRSVASCGITSPPRG